MQIFALPAVNHATAGPLTCSGELAHFRVPGEALGNVVDEGASGAEFDSRVDVLLSNARHRGSSLRAVEDLRLAFFRGNVGRGK